ncbi:hypothetical protein E2C01_003385 [Portunus trituberculatus]|uniref:Uncharacterized protein n=1 Tax=Portunus trituberculatus TaxID=210409 RepID=A0A5B7CNK3_PORTR|nr:hypothetical protein [Portunus trituberculatus]
MAVLAVIKDEKYVLPASNDQTYSKPTTASLLSSVSFVVFGASCLAPQKPIAYRTDHMHTHKHTCLVLPTTHTKGHQLCGSKSNPTPNITLTQPLAKQRREIVYQEQKPKKPGMLSYQATFNKLHVGVEHKAMDENTVS